jgi:hypothetical protein
MSDRRDLLTVGNPTMAYIRSIIGECLHSIHKEGGLVVSVTTDGFITNLQDLERKISGNYLFGEFKKIRLQLSEDDTGLEIKHRGKGIIAWSTRGQLGIESRIIATTGFQHRAYYNKDALIRGFLEAVKMEHKAIPIILPNTQSFLQRLQLIVTRIKQGEWTALLSRKGKEI